MGRRLRPLLTLCAALLAVTTLPAAQAGAEAGAGSGRGAGTGAGGDRSADVGRDTGTRTGSARGAGPLDQVVPAPASVRSEGEPYVITSRTVTE